MSAFFEADSTLTDRYQTTVPEAVRQFLGLGKRDKLRYTLKPNGEVVLTRRDDAEVDDPALAGFLAFLATDMADHPEHLSALDAGLVQRIQSLTQGVALDLNAPLDDEGYDE